MNILTIDTATDYEFIYLSAEGEIFEFAKDVKTSHSITMFRSLESILSDASLTIRDINLIGVGIGPGSFTGVRIAVSTARMIAQILNIPLVGVNTQEIFVSSVSNEPSEKILVAFDAKKSRVFGALYGGGVNSGHITLVEAGDYTIESMLSHVSADEKLLCIGDGCGRYMESIAAVSASSGFSFRYIENLIPDGTNTSSLVLRKYKESPERYGFYGNTVPLYARKSDAETARDERKLNTV